MKDTPSVCRFCGTTLLWGQRADGGWVSLEPNPEGTWVRDLVKRCWKLAEGEQTSLPRFDPHRPLCARRVKAAQDAKPEKKQPEFKLPQLDLFGIPPRRT